MVMQQLAALGQKIQDLRKELVQKKLAPETGLPAIIDKDSANVEELNRQLRGSILRLSPAAGTKYLIVPATTSPVSGLGTAPKLQVAKKWDQLGSPQTVGVAELCSQGLDGAILGILSLPTAAGAAAGELKIGALAAKIEPPASSGGGAVQSVSIVAGGSTVEKTVDEAVQALGLQWRPWAGRPGGLAAVPAHADLVEVAAAKATVLLPDAVVGPIASVGSAGLLARAALTNLGLFDASGEVTAGELAGFLTAAAGVGQAAPMLAVILAAPHDSSTEVKKMADSWAVELRRLCLDVAAAVPPTVMHTVMTEMATLATLGFPPSGRQLGEVFSRVATAEAAAALASHPVTVAIPAPAAAVAAPAAVPPAPAPAPVVALGGATSPDPLMACLSSLSLDPAVRAAVMAAMAPAAAGAAASTSGPPNPSLHFAELRPAGADGLADAEVLGQLGGVLTPSVSTPRAVSALAAELATQRGAAPASTLFSGGSAAAMEQAADDYEYLVEKAGLSFEGRPASWSAAAERLHKVVLAAGRAQAGGGGGRGVGSEASKRARSALDEEDVQPGWFKPCQSAGKATTFAAAGDLLTPLADTSFARAEAVAVKPSGAIQKVRRLVDMPGDVGEGAAAFIFSDGTVSGAAPKAGIAASVHDARSSLREYVITQIELVVRESRVDAVNQEIAALADAILVKRAYQIKKAAAGEAEVVMDSTCLYPLAVYLLGGTPPERSGAFTERELLFQGRWGTRAGQQSIIDVPVAMLNLSRLLGAVDAMAGGGPLGAAQADAASDGFGLTELARSACGKLEPAKVDELMKDLFMRAHGQAARRRTRAGPPIDWPALVAEAKQRKVEPLIAEQRSEHASRRIHQEEAAAAKAAGRKSPLGRGEEEGEGSPSKRSKKKEDFVAGQKAEREAKRNAKAAAALLAPGAPAPAAAAAAAATATAAAAPTAAAATALKADSITDLTDKQGHKGAVEVLQRLYTKEHPDRRQREQQPCPFLAIRGSCRDGPTGGCVQCSESAKLAASEKPPPFSDEMLKAVKAACTARVQKAFK